MRKISERSRLPLSARLMLDVPVYPEEVTVRKLAKDTGKSAGYISLMISALPVAFPIAERTSGHDRFLCFPSAEAKEQAFKGAVL